MIVKCCKCGHRTLKWICPKCSHRICTSCKDVMRREDPVRVKVRKLMHNIGYYKRPDGRGAEA